MAELTGTPAEPTDVLDTTAAGGRIVRGGALRAAGYVTSTLVALIGVALITRHLGVAEYGRYQTILSLITIVGAVTDAGMGTLGLREFSQLTGPRRDELMRVLLGMRLALTLAGVGIAVAITAAAGYDASLVVGAALAGVGLLLTVLQTTLSIPLGAALRNGALTGFDLLRQVLTVAGFAILVAAGSSVTWFLAVPVPVGIVVVAGTAMLVRRQVPLRPSIRLREWLALLRSAVAFALATAVGTIYIYTAQILTAFMASDRETGLFAVSFRVFIVAAAIPGLLVTVAFPLLARAARDDRVRLAYAVQRLFDATSLLGIGIALGVVVGAPAVIAVMAGPDYADASGALRIQSLTMLASFALAPWGFALLSLHLHRGLLIANALAFAVSAAAVTSLAASAGSKGAAAGTVLGEMTLAVGYAIVLTRHAPAMRPQLVVPLKGLLAAAPPLALMLVLPAVPATILALAAYALALVALRIVPAEIWEIVPWRR
jgi:O-antigen/teichoic acid export membrane protein